MRTSLSTIREVAQYWAQQKQDEGKASNLFFEKDSLYSYGKHFCVGRHIAPGVVALTTFKNRSQSTRLHLNMATYETSHLKVVRCFNPDESAWKNRETALVDIKLSLDDAVLPLIRQPRRDRSNAEAERLAKQFNEYLAALQSDSRRYTKGGDTSLLPETAQALRDYFVVQFTIERLES